MTTSATPSRPLFRVHASVAVVHDDRVLVVQEAKADCRGQWNLPGGHVDHGERIPAAAARELREETELTLPIAHLVGIYTGLMSVRFAFGCDGYSNQPFAPGDEVLDVRFMRIGELTSMPDDQLQSPVMLRTILRDLSRGQKYPLEMFDGA
jgi:ADP-ribose pyrophosphatase YjhB (NUDIX family)